MAGGSKTTGIVLAVLGLILLLGGGIIYAVTPAQTSSNLLNTDRVVTAGGFHSIGLPLNSGDQVSVSFHQVNGSSVFLYFMNSTQQHDWGNCAPCTSPSILNASNPSTYSFSKIVPSAGTYYVILDNSGGSKNVEVQLTADLITGTGVATWLTALFGVSLVLLIVGAAITFMRKTPPSVPK